MFGTTITVVVSSAAPLVNATSASPCAPLLDTSRADEDNHTDRQTDTHTQYNKFYCDLWPVATQRNSKITESKLDRDCAVDIYDGEHFE